MWKGAAQLILVISVCCTARSELPPSPTSLYLEDDLLASTSPLAQLLASATGATAIGSSPLIFPAITGLKNKRKPLRFKSKGQSRFKPKNLRKKNKAVSEKQPSIKVDDSADIKPRFSSFQKRPSPVLLEPERSTTTQPLLLTDFFGTPEPPVSRNKINPASLITPGKTGQKPFVFDISNDITDGDFSDDLFEKLQTITGAKAIGVTRDRALVGDQRGRERKGSLKSQTKTELSRNEVISEIVTEKDVSDKEQVRKKKERRRGKLSGRRKKVDRVRKKQQEETTESVKRQGKAVSFVKASRPPRRKKSNFIRRKRNKARVGTVDRYRYENEDGSITWGYQNDDGSFKEETIGVDCITHGKYGFIDSNGEKREYSYSSGIRCDPTTRKGPESDPNNTGGRGANGKGFYDYTENKFVMPNGRRVTVVVNEGNKARGRRY